jgi:DNA invertase Pin-like site-specific DNA recombinase
MKSMVAYVRISKDSEGRQVGIERQQQDCQRLAKSLGVTIAQIFADNDTSASTLSKKKRPAFEEMMTMAESGQVTAILAYSNSRLTRRPLELERLIAAHDRTGVQFHTVVSGHDDLSLADGRMIARIKASVDAAESERMGERIRRAQQQMREQGRWHGGWRPFGFQTDGVTPDEVEGAVIAEACEALLSGRSMLGIARDLNEQGLGTSTGKKWSTRTLARVLLRPHPAVDDSTSQAVREILENPDRRTTPGPARKWLLTSLIHCGLCNGPMGGSATSKGAGLGTYPAYRCKTGKHVVVNALTLDEYISEVVITRLEQPDVAELLVQPTRRVEATRLSVEARTLRRRKDLLADNLDMDERTLALRSRALQDRIEAIEEQLAAAARPSPLAPFTSGEPREIWGSLNLELQRNVIAFLMSVTVVRGARGVIPRNQRWRPDLPSFDPRRIVIDWKVQ